MEEKTLITGGYGEVELDRSEKHRLWTRPAGFEFLLSFIPGLSLDFVLCKREIIMMPSAIC